MPARPTYVPNRRPGDDHIFEELGRRDYEALYALKPRDVVVDIGAHAGFFASYAAERVGPEGLVIAFEPEEDNFRLLVQNTSAYYNVHPMRFAIWDRDEVLHLSLSHSSAEHSLVYKRLGSEVQMVHARRLDEIWRATGFDKPPHCFKPAFIKIDVEGAELRALVGAHDLIKKHRPHLAMELAEEEIEPVTRYLRDEHAYTTSWRRNGGGVFLYGTP